TISLLSLHDALPISVIFHAILRLIRASPVRRIGNLMICRLTLSRACENTGLGQCSGEQFLDLDDPVLGVEKQAHEDFHLPILKRSEEHTSELQSLRH